MLEEVISTMCALGERQGAKLETAARLLEKLFSERGLPYRVSEHHAAVPRCRNCHLTADGVSIPVENCSITGGVLPAGSEIITNLQSSQNHLRVPNINYNEKCTHISTANYYHAPALAINFTDLEQVRSAARIVGASDVWRYEFVAKQFLVGNLEHPERIFFCHYDSVCSGAVDNASGVAVLIEALSRHPSLARTDLFVFDATEELSYDFPIYWGYGYRVFEERYRHILERAGQIIVVDCVGYCAPVVYSDPKLITLAFPIRSLDRIIGKVRLISGVYDELMAFYHSKLDIPDRIRPTWLVEALDIALSE